MIFLQAEVTEESVEQVEEATQQVADIATAVIKDGDTSQLSETVQQLVNLGIEAGKSIIVALLIYFVGKFIVKLIKKLLIGMMQRRNMDPTIQTFLSSFVSVTLNVLLVITVISALGVNTTSFAALLASVGVAVGMALSGNLQNLAGGLIVLLFKPYRVGDYVEAQGVQGVVKEIQIFHTIILTVDNKQIHVPNGALSSGTVTNYSTMPQRRVDLTIGMEYGADLEKVRQVILDTVAKDPNVLKEGDFAPFVRVCELADSSVNFTVRLWCEGANYWNVFFDNQEAIYAEFQRQGISFPYPHLNVTQKG